MNYLSVAVTAIFIICILIGYKHGLFRSVLKIVMLGVSLLLSYFFAPMVGNLIIRYTNVDDYFKTRIYTVIEENVRRRVKETLEGELGLDSDEAVNEITNETMKVDPAKVQQIDIINNLDMPEFVKTALLDNNHDEARKSLGVNGFYEYISTYISYMIVNAMAFVVTFIFVMIIFAIVSIAMSAAIRIPIVGGINRLGGMMFGFLQALLIIWFLFVLVAIFSDTHLGVWFFNQIDDSKMLTFIYNKNLFMRVVTGLAG